MESILAKFCAYDKGQPVLPLPSFGPPPPVELAPFAQASTYGLDLVYPYETECQVIAEQGTIHFEWDFAKEPGVALTGGEFRLFSPVEASQYYLFNTRLDLLPPPGHVVRTEPHPRYFTDTTGAVPLSMIGHLQNEWYPRQVFVVFRTPPPGRRHIFRKGEPFARILLVPQHMKPAVPAPAAAPAQIEPGGPLVLTHQPIRMTNAAWGGAPQKMEDGSEPQPWHCAPFVEASTYGLELLYPRHAEGAVTNVDGKLLCRGAGLNAEIAPGFYQLHARLDLQPPPGHTMRILPHPRYFTDSTGSVPLPLISHLSPQGASEVPLVFRAPGAGQEHVFRSGEPIAQLVFVPDPLRYDILPMSVEEETRRRTLENQIESSRLDIADHTWRNPAGVPFNNHYKMLARVFARSGLTGVEEVAQQAVAARKNVLAGAKSVAELMTLGIQWLREQKYVQAKDVFALILKNEPNNAAAHSGLGVSYAGMGNAKKALASLTEAVALQPHAVNFQFNLGDFLRRQGRLPEAAATFRRALALAPADANILFGLALTTQEQRRPAEAISFYRAALAAGRTQPQVHFGLGTLLAAHGDLAEARACFEAALALAPNFTPARQALEKL